MLALFGLMPQGAGAQNTRSQQAHPSLRPDLPISTPDPGSPAFSLSPNSGPVGTTVSFQGSGWPAKSTVLLKYSAKSCTSQDLQEIPDDPKPTVDSAGAFGGHFSWPALAQAGFWIICAVTSDSAATSSASFDELSASAPSVSMTTTGTITFGQAISVQGQNWLPGGLVIAFSLQPIDGSTSYPLDQQAVSLKDSGIFNPDPTSLNIPPSTSIPPGQYVLVASAENEALQASTAPFTIAAQPTPTSTPPPPSPTPQPTNTPTLPPIHKHSTLTPHHQLGGPLLALVVISTGMALSFALVGAALLIYLMRTRQHASAKSASR